MARIAGVDLPKNKRMEIALTYIYGIGRTKSSEILRDAGVSPDTKTDQLADSEITSIRNIIDKELKVEGDLRREISMSIKRLMDVGTLPRFATSEGTACQGPENEYQRPNQKRTEKVDCRQEEIGSGGIRRINGKASQKNREKEGKEKYLRGDSSHSVYL